MTDNRPARMHMIGRYLHWLHTRWPSGRVEKLPLVNDDGSTNVPGLFVTGDLRGVPLLKFAADSGARVVQAVCADASFQAARKRGGGMDGDVLDLAIIGGGVSGIAAAMEARTRGLSFRVFEASEMFSTIANFPKAKPIFTYPRAMTPAGALQVRADVKEALLGELVEQARDAGIRVEAARVESTRLRGGVFEVALPGGEVVRALRVICALGQSGDFRRLGVPGEELDKVFNRLHDPKDFAGRSVLVVGGGDSALETTIALVEAGAAVTLSYRKPSFHRPKTENVEAIDRLARDPGAGSLRIMMSSVVKEIRPQSVQVQTTEGGVETVPNDVVFVMIGRDAPLDFFRRSGVSVRGDWSWKKAAGLAAFVAFCTALYNWKSGGRLGNLFYQRHWWPVSIGDAAARDPTSFAGVIATSASSPSFWYTLAYSLAVVVFGIRRIRRRRTPYVTAQTWVLMAIQVLPLFVLPEIVLPYLGKNGLLPAGFLDALFPAVDYGNGREYWRAYGLILAWPLNVYNVFTAHPLPWWLAIAFVQTCVLIPLAIYFWGKGAYCGWVCSCGALAETLGDTHRTKMVHGPRWNRANAVGQGVLAVAVLMLVLRVVGWTQPPDSWANRLFPTTMERYKWIVDVFLAGVIGYGFYFWFSGRVWCRFACPLAALMHVYARFSRFGIVAEKKKCISCNVCTSVCHQGIDVMNFANKGLTMQDPECVRCSACVHSCPTGVLSFAQVGRNGKVLTTDRLAASPVRMREH